MVRFELNVKGLQSRIFRAHNGRVAFVALSLCGFAGIIESSELVTQLAHTAWTTRDARLPGAVFAITQTPDGFIWIGTEFGLVRFDGVHFQDWQPPRGERLTNRGVTALLGDRDGGLWIGSHSGLTHWIGDSIEQYHTSTGATGPAVSAILQDREGHVWVATIGAGAGGLCRVDGKLLNCDSALQATASPGILSLFEDRRGNLWVGGRAMLYRRKPDPGMTYSLPDSHLMISSVAEDREGTILVSTDSEGGLYKLLNGKLEPYRRTAVSSRARPSHLLADKDGSLWIGTLGQGILHLSGGRIDKFVRADGLSNNIVRCLFEDREGNIWVGTDDGLDRFRRFPVTTISKREGLSAEVVTSVLASKSGDIWIGTTNGLDRIDSAGSITHVGIAGSCSPAISGLFEETDGRLWANCGTGFAALDRASHNFVVQAPARNIGSITAATEDRDRSMWLSSPSQGLVHSEHGEIKEIVPWSFFANKKATALETDPDRGGLWLGFLQGGIAYWKPGESVRWYGSADGLGDAAVMDLHFSREVLWIATQGGLSELSQERITTLRAKNGLPCEQINAMAEDNDHALWLNTACGLVRINADDLASWSAKQTNRVALKVFDSADGMRIHTTAKGYYPRASKSSDGRLWFNVLEGVAVIDPKNLSMNPLPPPVQIERAMADRQECSLKAGLRLQPRIKDFEIEYAGLSFVDPDRVRFRYKLEGADGEWHEADGRRQVTYTNLAPHQYRFQVIASNNDGVWNHQGAALEFTVPPAFYQTTWFRLLCATGVLLLAWSWYRLRLRQIAAQLNLRFEERLAERSRIARDLHDNLLQNIAGFALQLEGLSKLVLTKPVLAKDRLRELRQEAERWLHDAREAVWDLRSPPLAGREFLTALRETAEDITGAKGIRLIMTVSGSRRPLPEELGEQLLRIIREAIRNAARHGNAREVRLEVGYPQPDTIEIQISDDGCGFILEEGAQKMGHYGLSGMQERALNIGADLKIATSPGSGT